jgi:hypothetical protein
MSKVTRIRNVSALATILLAAGCGGGGSSMPGTPPVTTPPVVTPPVVTPPDPTPPSALLVPPGSEVEFTSFIKRGLAQWGGLDPNVRPEAVFEATPFDVQLAVVRSTDEVAFTGSPDASAESSGTTFSGTNLVVGGVDEFDSVKFDGEHMYALVAGYLQVVAIGDPAGGRESEIIAQLAVDDDVAFGLRGMYQDGDRLAVISGRSYGWGFDWFAPWGWSDETGVSIVAITDPSSPSVESRMTIDGVYVDSRRVGDHLYLVTRYTAGFDGMIRNPESDSDRAANQALIDGLEVNDVLPRVNRDGEDVGPLVTADACFVPAAQSGDDEWVAFPTLTTITRISITDPSDIQSVCMAESVYGVYVSPGAVYLAAYDQGDSADRFFFQATRFHKFAIGSSGPNYLGTGKAQGVFWGDPKFLMGEVGGDLVAITSTTEGFGLETRHRLTTLRQADDYVLETLAVLPNEIEPAPIGKPGEQIFASRFVGDRAYVVTFLRIDPVYAIDLADRAAPRILGELEIDGFSSYLHPVGENLLLGIGRDATVDERFTQLLGINVRLFDVTDPANMQVLGDMSFGGGGSYLPLGGDNHELAYLAGEDGRHRFAFAVSLAGSTDDAADDQYAWRQDSLEVFEIDDREMTLGHLGSMVFADQDSGMQFNQYVRWYNRPFLLRKGGVDEVHSLFRNELVSATVDALAVPTRLRLRTVFGEPDETTLCTADFRIGLYLNAIDRVTHQWLDCVEARISNVDGFVFIHKNSCSAAGQLAFGETRGTFDVTIDHPGYESWTMTDVLFEGDECHVSPTQVNAHLTPAAGATE